jgi:exosortase J
MRATGNFSSAMIEEGTSAAAGGTVTAAESASSGKQSASAFAPGWWLLGIAAALGMLGLAPQFIALWQIWTGDPLRSIGMLLAPVAVILTLRSWRQAGWELRGTWWGILPILFAYALVVFSRNLVLSLGRGPSTVNFIPHVLPIYLYASGVVLLFGGVSVWRRAWFPLAMLLCLQPVPAFAVHAFDLPLQGVAAHVARGFAGMIGFSPSSPELLRLMFTPDFGMFIAPGCDGMRGAVTLGYLALIVGYLKRVSVMRWIAYVAGAVLLGHLFNLIRLCALVLYYRAATGHPAMEAAAKNADYAIGGCLFLVASILFLRVVVRKPDGAEAGDAAAAATAGRAGRGRMAWQLAAFSAVVLAAAVPGVRAIEINREGLFARTPITSLTPAELNSRLPAQLGEYKLSRAWQEQSSGLVVLESAAYDAPGSAEIILGIWLKPTGHSIHESWMTHGDSPEARSTVSYKTGSDAAVSFDTALYSDGITDSLVGNVDCTPTWCTATPEQGDAGVRAGFSHATDFTTRGVRMVPIFFRLEVPHANATADAVYQRLQQESRNFLGSVDLREISRQFQ